MPSMMDIKNRMKSIKGTQQMTKAMNLVASAKLGRAKQRLIASRPYNEASTKMLKDILSDQINHPFLTKKEGDTLFIAINGDRGLCGGYNINIIKEVEAKRQEANLSWDQVSLYTVGKKCTDIFTKQNRKVIGSNVGISESPTYQDAMEISKAVVSEFLEGRVTKVVLAYTYFESVISHIPKTKTLLPMDPKAFRGSKADEKPKDVFIYEPGKEALLDYLLPSYLTALIYEALVESAACEQGARMTSMDSATKNAKEALSNMNLLYNRARQAAITQEISEIVGGANAIQGG